MPKKQNTLATLGETPVDTEAAAGPPPTYGFEPPQLPQGFLDLQSYNPTTPIPQARGGITLPLAGNQLTVGGYYAHDPYAPGYGFNFGLRRQF